MIPFPMRQSKKPCAFGGQENGIEHDTNHDKDKGAVNREITHAAARWTIGTGTAFVEARRGLFTVPNVNRVHGFVRAKLTLVVQRTRFDLVIAQGTGTARRSVFIDLGPGMAMRNHASAPIPIGQARPFPFPICDIAQFHSVGHANAKIQGVFLTVHTKQKHEPKQQHG